MKIEDLSDEAFNDLTEPTFSAPAEDELPAGQEEQEEPASPPITEEEPTVETAEGEADADRAAGEGEEGEKPEGDEDLSDADLDKKTPPVFTPAPEKPEGEKTAPEPEKKEAPKEGVKPAKEAAPAAKPAETDQIIDYKSEFEKLIGKPIKANGKEITLKNADEAIRLIQQGAGYANKMEQLKPARKSAAMLESAGLLGDETALSHMIDLYNGNPAAIAKLVKDLKIDIFALDLDAGDQYTPVSHLQTDETVNFAETLKEVRTLEGGQQAMALIDAMDPQSKQMIWGNAKAIRQIYDYKQSGVYDTVANEVERRRTLGEISPDIPFIVAFGQVGEEMAKATEQQEPDPAPLQPVTPPTPVPAKPVERTPVASGPAPRKPDTADARAAAAAASPRSGAGGEAKQPIDIYQYSDADIEKMSAPPV